MKVENLFLYFLACGAATFPLTLSAVYLARSLRGAGRTAGSSGTFERALALSLVIWIAGALVFYAVAVQIERRKPCIEQHTNQLTDFCKKELGSTEPDD
jgi:hypothetical protein